MLENDNHLKGTTAEHGKGYWELGCSSIAGSPSGPPRRGREGGEGGSHTRSTHESDLMSSLQKEMESQGMGMTCLRSHVDFMSKLGPEPGILIATFASRAQLLCFPCTSLTLFT